MLLERVLQEEKKNLRSHMSSISFKEMEEIANATGGIFCPASSYFQTKKQLLFYYFFWTTIQLKLELTSQNLVSLGTHPEILFIEGIIKG